MALHLCPKEDGSECASDLLSVQLRFYSNGRRGPGRLRARGRVQAVLNQSSVDGSTTCRHAIQVRHLLTDRRPVVADHHTGQPTPQQMHRVARMQRPRPGSNRRSHPKALSGPIRIVRCGSRR